MASVLLGLLASYWLDWPSGATVILTQTALFAVAAVASVRVRR